MNRVIIVLLALFSPLAYAQGEYLYVNAEGSEKYGVLIELNKEQYYNRWCIQLTYPMKSSFLNEGVFNSINYLLKREYKDAKKDIAPAMSLKLDAALLKGGNMLRTEFCLAKEYYQGAEIQIHYINNNYENIVVWIQNMDLLIEKEAHNKAF